MTKIVVHLKSNFLFHDNNWFSSVQILRNLNVKYSEKSLVYFKSHCPAKSQGHGELKYLVYFKCRLATKANPPT